MRAFDAIVVLQNHVYSEGKLQAWWQFSDAALNLASWECSRVGKSQTTCQICAMTCFFVCLFLKRSDTHFFLKFFFF